MLKIYGLLVLILAIATGWFGFILPLMISGNDIESILGVLVTVLIVAPVLFRCGWSLITASKDFMRPLACLLVLLALGACSRVPVGEVGIKVKSIGTEKGVEADVLSPGLYYIGVNEQLYLFPTSMLQYVWTASSHEGAVHDESMTFQDKSGIPINADFGVAYQFDLKSITKVFEQYRQGPEAIRNILLRNDIRDTLVEIGALYSVDELIGPKKAEFLEKVNVEVRKDMASRGIIVDRIYSVDRFRLTEQLQTSINLKIQANQLAEQKQNELKQSEADAAKRIADAKGFADADIARAQGTAAANAAISASITPDLLQFKAIEKWSGNLPLATGSGAMPFVNLEPPK